MQDKAAEYKPKIADTMNPDDLLERATVAANTVRRWKQEHNEKTEYHNRFKGWCTECTAN